VKDIANRLIFEPNRESTLSKFDSLVRPRLQRIQELQGLDAFKVKIDTTTTSQADVENNTIRGQIYLLPTKTVEFISLDFVVTNAGTVV
jgi:phage tail sheath protein FI